MRAAAGRVARRRRPGLLVLPVAHPLRRRRHADQLAPRGPARDARVLRRGGRARGHDARVHHERLPRLLQPRRGRADDGHERHRAAAAQLERADRRRALGRADRAPALGVVRRGGRRWSHRRSDHADARADEHELPHPLRALPHPRLGRRDGAARGGAHGASWPIPPSAPSSTSAPAARRPGSSAACRTGAPTSSATRTPPPTRAAPSARSADIAAERGTAPFDTLLDIVLADDLRTVLWPNTDDGDEATWAMRAAIWDDPRAMVGGSDAGAHLDRMCGSSYPTAFLADCLRGPAARPRRAAPCT